MLVSCSQLGMVVERWSSLSNGRVAASWVGRLLSLWEKVNLLSRPGIPLGSQSSLARALRARKSWSVPLSWNFGLS
ncbi:Uncharacterised protein [Klebsiella pneumoniae]|nr:Uncharacterised protein [Klebsiella pneumoniae]